jgi:hypothetical protein
VIESGTSSHLWIRGSPKRCSTMCCVQSLITLHMHSRSLPQIHGSFSRSRRNFFDVGLTRLQSCDLMEPGEVSCTPFVSIVCESDCVCSAFAAGVDSDGTRLRDHIQRSTPESFRRAANIKSGMHSVTQSISMRLVSVQKGLSYRRRRHLSYPLERGYGRVFHTPTSQC